MGKDTVQSHNSKTRKRHRKRSTKGCLTCKRRKLKCDENHPTCQRCTIEEQECLGYGDSSDQMVRKSPQDLHSNGHNGEDTCFSYDTSTLLSENTQTQTSIGLFQPGSSSQVSEPSEPFPAMITAVHDYLNTSAFEELIDSLWRPVTPSSSIHCTNDLYEHCGTPKGPNIDGGFDSSMSPAIISREAGLSGSAQPPKSTRQRVWQSALRSQIEQLCTDETQSRGVWRFFNHVAVCFHLIPSEANRWCIEFAALCGKSDMILSLVIAVGLVSDSASEAAHERSTAYVYLTKGVRALDSLLSQAKENGWYSKDQGTHHNWLQYAQINEIIAAAILVGHMEQFDTGVERHTNKYMTAARQVMETALFAFPPQPAVNQGAASPFRFFTRIWLWWDTMSCTMGPGTRGPHTQNIFDVVRQWEEDEAQPELVFESTQCVCGWPLDLLESVARTTVLLSRSGLMEEQTSSDTGMSASSFCVGEDMQNDDFLRESRSIEMQIRNCRPKVVVEDNASAAELRFLVLKILQSGSLLYLSHAVSRDTLAVGIEMDRILNFMLNRFNTSRQSHIVHSESTDDAPDFRWNVHVQQDRSTLPTYSLGWRHPRAPDGNVAWAYMQASMLARSDQQAACRAAMNQWRQMDFCDAILTAISLLDDVWQRRNELEKQESTSTIGSTSSGRFSSSGLAINSTPTNFNWKYVLHSTMKQRRWKQLLLF